MLPPQQLPLPKNNLFILLHILLSFTITPLNNMLVLLLLDFFSIQYYYIMQTQDLAFFQPA